MIQKREAGIVNPERFTIRYDDSRERYDYDCADIYIVVLDDEGWPCLADFIRTGRVKVYEPNIATFWISQGFLRLHR